MAPCQLLVLLRQLHICYLCTALSSAEMDGFADYEKAMLVGQNKQLQILKVAVSTLHKGVEISVQLHKDLMDITPLLQEAMNTVRLCCGSRLLHAASWPCSAPLSPSHQGCLWACCRIDGCCLWACCKIGGCLLQVGGCCMWACCKLIAAAWGLAASWGPLLGACCKFGGCCLGAYCKIGGCLLQVGGCCLWACCKVGGCLLQNWWLLPGGLSPVEGCCLWACCKVGGCLLQAGGLLQIGGGCSGAVPGLQSSRA